MIKNLFTPPEDTQGAKKQTRNRDVGKRQKLSSYWGAKQQNIDGHLMAYVWHALVQTCCTHIPMLNDQIWIRK